MKREGDDLRGNFVTDRNGCKNPNYKDGRKDTRLYRIYRNILTRCDNESSPSYNRYGGRGITICDEWKQDFKHFYDWSIQNGYKDNLTIDRIDNNGNYEPSNCRWVTMKEQSKNNSKNHILTLNNESHCLSEWCESHHINYKTVRDRLKRGWDYERALTETVQTKFRKK